MAKRKFEDILADLRESDVDSDLLEELEGFTGSRLRERAERLPEMEAENTSLKAQIAKLEDEPKRRAAFEQYGINLAELRPAEREALMAVETPEEGYTPEWVGSIAEKYDLEVSTTEREVEGEGSPADRIAAQANSPVQRSGKATLTPEDTAEWSTEKLLKFREEHKEEFEALKRGETVVGIAV